MSFPSQYSQEWGYTTHDNELQQGYTSIYKLYIPAEVYYMWYVPALELQPGNTQ